MRHPWVFGVALAVALSLASGTASANGRFPRAQQLIENPNDPAHLILRSTYGILVTKDAGSSWFWICEKAVGYGGTDDPALGLTESGRLLAGIFDGLSMSADGGCDWSFAGGALADRYVVDLTVEKNDRTRALAMVSMGGQPNNTFLNQLFRSTDSGATWAQLGSNLDPNLLLLTLDPAPSDSTRIYVSALEFGGDGGASQGYLLRSTDDGTTFEPVPIAGTSLADSPFIGAVDPVDPLRVYVRVAGNPNDKLLVSSDGGTTFTEVLSGQAELFGFALSPDGATVLAGFGDPRDGNEIDESVLGIWSASTTDLQFSRIYDKPVACLTWTPNRLYACTGQFDAGFELGVSSDAGATFSSLMELADLQGPLECPAGTKTGDLCPPDWEATCETIGKCVAGTGGSAGSAGGAGSGGDSSAEDDGCGCRTPGRTGPSAMLALLLGALVVLARRLL